MKSLETLFIKQLFMVAAFTVSITACAIGTAQEEEQVLAISMGDMSMAVKGKDMQMKFQCEGQGSGLTTPQPITLACYSGEGTGKATETSLWSLVLGLLGSIVKILI